ncbi:hypothetical protein PR048_007029 [Dryococelus australis]|uniref:Uncharacterized protein n=1 Tax=Dryococelus australis TaxID=614101 RepID=A0ABQ9ICH4_9NEOP|nr:hypothetical protein PR048_007029 [Dryococelus australis]
MFLARVVARRGVSESASTLAARGEESIASFALQPSARPYCENLFMAGAVVAERLACSRPTKAVRRPGHSRIFACGNRAGQCRYSAGFLGDLPFPSPFHSGAASYSPESPSSVLKLRRYELQFNAQLIAFRKQHISSLVPDGEVGTRRRGAYQTWGCVPEGEVGTRREGGYQM